jgi:hypothetical protein
VVVVAAAQENGRLPTRAASARNVEAGLQPEQVADVAGCAFLDIGAGDHADIG